MWRRKRTAASLVLTACLLAGCGRAPQLGSETSHHVVDALWTAVTARRLDLVEKVAADLKSLEAAGELTPEAAAALAPVLADSRDKQWERAAKRLKKLIQAQRK